MNVYEKLNQARIDFQCANVKKSGQNKFAGYTYYELSDILPAINVICAKLKATTTVRFSDDLAFLEFVDCEKPEDRILFTSPMSEASLKGCHAVQNLGAVQTYIKRYLYQNCFEIVENDCLDMTMNPNDKPKQEVKKTESKGFDEETTRMINDVRLAIKLGKLTGDYQKKAEFYCQNGDKEGLKRLIQYLADTENNK